MATYYTLAMQRLFPSVVTSKSLFIPMYRTIAMSQRSFSDRYYTKKHEWVIIEGNTAIVGISDFAQAALGDIVYAELPEVGKELHAGDSVGAVESVKAASDIYSPISGTVTEKNIEVESNPSLINKSAIDKGWLYKLKVKDVNELKELMNETAYEAYKKMEEQEVAH
ncbi:glycine cleavage system H protein [Wuchereria bancrofti]|uniref:Glycine cleavage system H protein n=1 Tax=Wuchereria bancrofti TaxID=6293 RepID=J9AXD6_WUCBA|nr:glycine cleavage system H protein [Wuchereria bancrofti]